MKHTSSFDPARRRGVAPWLCLLSVSALVAWSGCATSNAPTSGAGAGSGTTGAGGSEDCAEGQARCGASCVDLQSDDEHCGSCEKSCEPEQGCVAGQCSLICGGGATRCGDACVDLQIDSSHCGSCTTICASEQVCAKGLCDLACEGGSTRCGESCVDLLVDPKHCGGCAGVCGAKEICNNGVCVFNCPEGLDECNGGCVDTANNNLHCGACGVACGAGQACAGGVCKASCQAGLSDCGAGCTNLDFDPANCGMCGFACQAGEACLGATCALLTPAATSCQAIVQNGAAMGDGLYNLDPDGPGGAAAFQAFCDMSTAGGGWTRCLDFTNTAAQDENGNTWLDRCVDWSMAAWTGSELMVRLEDESGVLLYTATGTRPSTWTHDKVTSSADAINQYDVSKHDDLVFLSNGDKLMIAGKTAANGGCWGSIGNGYGLAIYPPAPNSFQNLKILVLPYRNQVTDNQKRAFGAQGQSWFQDNEISASLAGFDTCAAGILPAQKGHFEMYVR